MITEELKKLTHTIDLARNAGRARQSKRTGFVHDEETIPLYENFCFALSLFRAKTAESVVEGKELVDRLLAFQSTEGNFPIFLHEYPRCFDLNMGLKVAPILIYLLRLFGPVLGDLKVKIEEALKLVLAKRGQKPLWENRYRACVGEPLLPVDTSEFSPQEWTQWIITAQLAGINHFKIPYDEELQLFMGHSGFDCQEGAQPRPNPIEWLLADGKFSPRLLQDHPHQLLCAPLFPVTFESTSCLSSDFRLFWNGSTLHSLVGKSLVFDLPETFEMGRSDLFEAALYTDISEETKIFIEGGKGTTFQLGDLITIQTPTKNIQFKFELTSGAGDFCGHIFRSNRPSQILKGYEAYDWQIAVRTLRREGPCQIKVNIL
ncbi:MAG: hypothetical protein COT85_01760 [Chlamydiae bacterium CG10_big_fil_rev_8_21_14_0_10_42_34]|nr:MAG: hypothetical protein COT85_01760 [Chlamydiae bacterium CG10_big_fil_rev_8_21_14_0_10_42_34]